MTPEELFEEKQHLVKAAIKQRFGGYRNASRIARINNMELDDLFQIAKIELWRLCLEFDSERYETFNPYAMITIKWKMSKELHEKGMPIRISSSISPEERNQIDFHSIDIQIEDDEKDGFFAVSEMNIEEEVLTSIEYQEVMNLITPEEQFVLVKKSFGYSDEEIGKEIGKSRSFVSRVKTAAFKKVNPNYKPIGRSSLLSECKTKKNHLLQQVI